MKKKSFEQIFALRSTVCFFLMISLMLFTTLRVTALNLKDYRFLQFSSNSECIKVGVARGSILDTNGMPITNSRTETIAAIMPTPAAVSCVKSNLSGDERARVLSLLESGKPAVTVFGERIECNGISYMNLPLRISENSAAHHIIGYLDGDGNGAYGIEKAYDEFLSDKSEIDAVFAVDGKGRPLVGTTPEFSGNTDKISNAVYLTLDINIQKSAEDAARDMKSGAVIVSECKTNKIRAMVSLPDFSPEDISASLNESNSPLVNKCLSAYNVGSVFKPVIAAAAIKDGKAGTVFNCTGNIEIEKRIFNCHKLSGHGTTDLTSAIKNSCNCYFYNLAINLGRESIAKQAEYFGMSSRIKLADNLFTKTGTIPADTELKTDSDIANFAIGQGNILLSPVALLNVYSAIANGGTYYMPSIVEKTSKAGKCEDYDIGKPTVAMNKNTSEILSQALAEVVNSGTGAAAKSSIVSSAGKTATAQTGRKNSEGREITNSWFCGFFPRENPKYTVIVMNDGECDKSPAEVFKDISEALK